MGINPCHPLCAPFYAAMRRLGLVLLSHTGVEHSVDFGFHDSQRKSNTAGAAAWAWPRACAVCADHSSSGQLATKRKHRPRQCSQPTAEN